MFEPENCLVHNQGDLVFNFLESGIPINEKDRVSVKKFNHISKRAGLEDIIYAEDYGVGASVHFRNDCCSHSIRIVDTNQMIQSDCKNTWSQFRKIILSRLFPTAQFGSTE